MKNGTFKDYLKYFTPAIIITLIGFLVAYQFVQPAPPRNITIATGQPGGAYYKLGQKYSHIRPSTPDRESAGLSVERLPWR